MSKKFSSLLLSVPARQLPEQLFLGTAFAGAGQQAGVWNDGRAELAFYDSERVVDDKPRLFKEQLITAKEDLREDTLVKADNPKAQKTIRVLKLNDVQKFDSDNYPYSFLTSVFVKDDPVSSVVKITIGSQEWNGNTFKIYKQGVLQFYSYLDAQADQSIPLDFKEGDLFEDQLPLSLRALLFKEKLSRPFRADLDLSYHKPRTETGTFRCCC